MELNKNSFAKRLKEVRLAKGLTQEDLSEKLGMEASNYSNFETGKTLPSMQTLVKIIECLQISPNELLEYNHLVDENDLDKKVMQIYQNLPLGKKRAAYKILRTIEDLTKNKL